MHKMVVIGEDWHGSDCTALVRGFRALGCAVEHVNPNRFIPAVHDLRGRLVRRLLINWFKKEFNKAILISVEHYKPDFILVYKGTFVKLETLKYLKIKGYYLTNFFPDVSFTSHTYLDPKTFISYDIIFTTKSFGSDDFKRLLNVDNVVFVPHGFDELVHKPILSGNLWKDFACDVSFIGGYSKRKEFFLAYLKRKLPEIHLRIWGGGWNEVGEKCLKDSIEGYPIYGDFYALAIQASKINLGLLLERVGSASSGDQITSRTFHIPAAGGFLLHQRTKEFLEYYVEGKEAACFETQEELVEKVKYYLSNDDERKSIAKAGYERCVKEYSYTARAKRVLEYIQERI